MRPLQDKCEPTLYEDVEDLFVTDMARPLSDYFDDFDPVPIGVASLAQVHVARWKETGEKVAVKVYSFVHVNTRVTSAVSSFNTLILPSFARLTWRWSKYPLVSHLSHPEHS